MIVAGIDKNGGHIYEISDPGVSYCFDSIGFCSEGSGSTQAESLFTYVKYSRRATLNRALFNIYEAKKRAEGAPGVGELTDVGIITEEKGVLYLTEAEESNLLEIYEKKIELERKKETEQLIDELKINGEKRE